MYAGRKRRKPAQKGVKATPVESVKSNPSKRHRDRLNSELDRLAGLLPFPEDIITSLDKLSILRLSVSYLRTKSFFNVALKDQLSNGFSKSSHHIDGGGGGGGRAAGCVGSPIPEGELLLQALNGFVMVVTAEGTIFFCSHTIQDYLGFHQTDVMHQSVFELIHTEDQQEFRRNLHWALKPPTDPGTPTGPEDGDSAPSSSCLVRYNPEQLPPENSSFLERGFICRFRCLLDNSSGFLALNIQGRLKFLHGQSHQQPDSDADAAPPQLALFAIATPLQPPAILEIRTRNMIFRTKHKLDFTPMACDAKGKIVLGYTEAELRVRGSGYQFIHAADMLYCAENHVRMIKTGESGLTVFRLLTKDNRWKWVQANARLVYKNGKPDYIIATQRPLADEEGGEQLRKRSMHLPFTFATGEALLYQTGYPLHGFPDAFHPKAKGSKAKKGRVDKSSAEDFDPKGLLGVLMSQDESVYISQPDSEPKTSYHSSLFTETRTEGFSGSSVDNFQVSNGDLGRSNGKTLSFDPLLATLDSLTLDSGEETCSNSELFTALENLGLNAEDLELLLLDERMIQVEMDHNHTPTLTDLLTNNEILSYIHDSLQAGAEGEEHGRRSDCGAPVHPSDPAASTPSVSQQAGLPPSSSSRPPIVQLSQQMQQHISTGQLLNAHPASIHSNNVTESSNSHWVVTSESLQHPHSNPAHLPLKDPQLNGEHKNVHLLLDSAAPPWQLPPEQHAVHHPLHQQLFHNGSYVSNGHAAFPPNLELSHADYGLSGTSLNGSGVQDVCHYQSVHAHHKLMQPQHRLEPPCPPQGPRHANPLDLEQILALSQPQHSLPSLDAYSMFNATQDAAHNKLENGRLLSAANAAYVRTCLMPNGNGVASGELPVSLPEPLPSLQDQHKSGFFL